MNENSDYKEQKENENDSKQQQLKNYIDSKFATNLLISKAHIINDEFQNHIKTVMNKFGLYQSGPLKVLDRCQSKLENDYYNEPFPTAAKLNYVIIYRTINSKYIYRISVCIEC
eukprot:386697_1